MRQMMRLDDLKQVRSTALVSAQEQSFCRAGLADATSLYFSSMSAYCDELVLAFYVAWMSYTSGMVSSTMVTVCSPSLKA